MHNPVRSSYGSFVFDHRIYIRWNNRLVSFPSKDFSGSVGDPGSEIEFTFSLFSWFTTTTTTPTTTPTTTMTKWKHLSTWMRRLRWRLRASPRKCRDRRIRCRWRRNGLCYWGRRAGPQSHPCKQTICEARRNLPHLTMPRIIEWMNEQMKEKLRNQWIFQWTNEWMK